VLSSDSEWLRGSFSGAQLAELAGRSGAAGSPHASKVDACDREIFKRLPKPSLLIVPSKPTPPKTGTHSVGDGECTWRRGRE